jgi:hypothetical protein
LIASAVFAQDIQTNTILTSAPNPSNIGQQVTLTATVSPTPSASSFNNNLLMDFLDGNTILAAHIPVVNGVAKLQTSFNTPGTHPLTARFTDTTGAYASSTGTFTQTVGSASTTTLTSSPNPSNVGLNVTFTATVSGPAGVVAPTGTVSFLDNGVSIGSANLSNGTAVFNITTLSAGTHSVVASYNGDGTYSTSRSNPLTQTVRSGTTTTLTSFPNPSNVGQAVTLTATVSPSAATGTVTFTDSTTGATLGGPVNLTNGTATANVSGLTAGTHSLMATYSGSTVYAPSTSAPVTQTVGSQSTTSLTVSPNPATVGQTVTLTATVSPATAATGAVSFFDGQAQIGSANLTSGVAALSVSNFAVGNHSITAVYNGSPSLSGSTSTAVVLTVNRPASSITLNVSPNPATQGQPVTLTAFVSPAAATGPVTFQDNGQNLGSSQLTNGVASIVLTTLAQGAHSLTAVYSGDNNYQGSTSTPVSELVNPPSSITTATTLNVSPNPSTFGQAVILTATVSPGTGPNGTIASGTVSFRDAGVLIGSIPLNNGLAVLSTTSLVVGNHPLTAVYSGDTNFNTSTSPPVTQLVNPQATSVFLTASPTTAQPGQGILFSAQVSPSSATGTVTFREGTNSIGSADLVAGLAVITVSTLSSGSHNITAVYAGGGNFGSSTSNSVTVSVGTVVTATTTTLSVAPTSPSYGDMVTLTANVTPATATGSVTFSDGSTNLGSTSLNAGTATLTTASFSAGSHSLTASYGGDNSNGASTSKAVTLTVAQAKTTTTLVVSPNPSSPGQSVTLTASVIPSTATGTVTFTDGGTNLGTGTVSGGTATFSSSTLAAGSHSLAASYSGDTNYSTSASAAVSLTVSQPTAGGPKITGPASLPEGTVGIAYSQTFTATGGTGQLTWSMVSSSTKDLTLSASGVLSGTPQTAGTFQLTVQVKDSASEPVTDSRTLSVTVNPLPTLAVSVNSSGGQNVPQANFGQNYPVGVTGTFTLSFTPNASNLPGNYTNPDVKFTNGATTAPVDIPANSTAAVSLPAVQPGSVAGTISVTLTGLKATQSGQAIPLPSPAPQTKIVIAQAAPVIVPGSVKITINSASSFQVTFNASSNTRELGGNGATLTFSAASGTTLNGATQTLSLASAGTTYFQDPTELINGGAFSVSIPFNYSGDMTALNTVSVTITNAVGTSAAVSGGR